MNTNNERNELIKKAVVDMNGDWLKGSGNGILALAKGDVNCIFLNQGGYWITGASWHEIFSWVIVCEGEATPICTIAEFEEAAAKWKEQQSVETPKVNYEELTFGELPRDEKLKLVEYVLDGGVVEYCYASNNLWADYPSEALCFIDHIKYRIKNVEPVTEKELFMREAKHYESIEQMFDSGKFKLVTDDGEE